MHGCYQHHKKAGGDRVDNVEVDTELGTCDATPRGESSQMSNPSKSSAHHQQGHLRKPAGIWGYVFQIIFQVIYSKIRC